MGQLGAPVPGGPGGGVRADLDPRRRDEPLDDGAVRRARRRGGEPAGRRAIIGYLRRHGRPLAVYTDHVGHFGQWLSRKEERTDSIIARGLGVLGVEVILTGSPQAKGRVERSFGTAQDRLIKEMRVAGVDTLGTAIRFLPEWWTPFWNERFAVAPRDPVDAHRPLPPGVDLDALFAETETRKVRCDFTIRFRNVYCQIPEREGHTWCREARLSWKLRFDGETRIRAGDLYLEPNAAGRSRPRPPSVPCPEKPARAQPSPPKPGPDHPWRRDCRNDVRLAVAKRRARERDAKSGTGP